MGRAYLTAPPAGASAEVPMPPEISPSVGVRTAGEAGQSPGGTGKAEILIFFNPIGIQLVPDTERNEAVV